MNIKQIANLEFFCEDLEQKISIEDYLKELLTLVWQEKECFSGKRPFGNSGWEYDIEEVLVKNKIVKGNFDGDGYIGDANTEEVDKIILQIIKQMGC